MTKLFKYERVYPFPTVSPDGTKIATLLTKEDGNYLAIGSFEEGIELYSVEIPQSISYKPYTWISNTEIAYTHQTNTVAILNINTRKTKTIGTRDGYFIPITKSNNSLIGYIDNITDKPQATIIKYNINTGDATELYNYPNNFYSGGVNITTDENKNIYILDIDTTETEQPEIKHYGISKITPNGNREFREIFDDASAIPNGYTNGWLIIQKGGLSKLHGKIAEQDNQDPEYLLYDWNTDTLHEFEKQNKYHGVDEQNHIILTDKTENEEETKITFATLNHDTTITTHTTKTIPTDFVQDLHLINENLYYRKPTPQYGLYSNQYNEYFLLEPEHPELPELKTLETSTIDNVTATIFGTDSQPKPAIILTYPSTEEILYKTLARWLIDEGYHTVGISYEDNSTLGNKLTINTIINKLKQQDCITNIGLFGHSAGGMEALLFTATYDNLDATVASAPPLNLKNGFKPQLKPVTFHEDSPGLYREYSPLNHAHKITTPTLLLIGENDTNVLPTHVSTFMNKTTDYTTLKKTNLGHNPFTQKAQQKFYTTITNYFDKHLK